MKKLVLTTAAIAALLISMGSCKRKSEDPAPKSPQELLQAGPWRSNNHYEMDKAGKDSLVLDQACEKDDYYIFEKDSLVAYPGVDLCDKYDDVYKINYKLSTDGKSFTLDSGKDMQFFTISELTESSLIFTDTKSKYQFKR